MEPCFLSVVYRAPHGLAHLSSLIIQNSPSTLCSRLTELSAFSLKQQQQEQQQQTPWSPIASTLVHTVLSVWETHSSSFTWISPAYSLGLYSDVTLTSETFLVLLVFPFTTLQRLICHIPYSQ